MRSFKKRIAVFLSLLLVIPAILGVLPTNTLTARAAGQGSIYSAYSQMTQYVFEDNNLVQKYKLTLEVGQKVDLSSMFYYSDSATYKALDELKGDTYKSSKTKVAAISQAQGTLQAKAKGTTNITIKYKGVTQICEVTVVKKKGFGLSSERSKLSKAVKALNKVYGGKVTSKNCYKVLQAYQTYSKTVKTYPNIDSSGFVTEKAEYGYYSSTNKLAVPEMLGLSSEVNEALSAQARNYNPVGTVQSAHFKIKSVTAKAKSRSFTINVTKKVNENNLFALQYSYSADDYIEKDDRAVFKIKVEDMKTGYKYTGWGIAQKNSSQLTINMDYLKFVKGRKYRLIGVEQWSNEFGWTNGYTFSAS